jgi:hypothetical protein
MVSSDVTADPPSSPTRRGSRTAGEGKFSNPTRVPIVLPIPRHRGDEGVRLEGCSVALIFSVYKGETRLRLRDVSWCRADEVGPKPSLSSSLERGFAENAIL